MGSDFSDAGDGVHSADYCLDLFLRRRHPVQENVVALDLHMNTRNIEAVLERPKNRAHPVC